MGQQLSIKGKRESPPHQLRSSPHLSIWRRSTTSALAPTLTSSNWPHDHGCCHWGGKPGSVSEIHGQSHMLWQRAAYLLIFQQFSCWRSFEDLVQNWPIFEDMYGKVYTLAVLKESWQVIQMLEWIEAEQTGPSNIPKVELESLKKLREVVTGKRKGRYTELSFCQL